MTKKTPDTKDDISAVRLKLSSGITVNNRGIETDLVEEVGSGFERVVFSCNCWTPEHHFFILQDKHDDELYLEMRLNSDLPWWVRLKNALKYLFNFGTAGYTEICLSKEDRAKLVDVLKVKKMIKLNPAHMKKLAGIKS